MISGLMKRISVLAGILILSWCQAFCQVSSRCTLVSASEGACDAVASYGAYKVIGAGLYVIILDCSDPMHPQRVGSLRVPGMVKAITVSGNLAYVAAESAGLRIIDLSDPANPKEIGFNKVSGWAENVVLSGHLAYVAALALGLRIIDVNNPSVPREVGFCATPGYALYVDVNNSTAYMADDESGLRIIDVKDPGAPVEEGFYDTPGSARAVAVRDNMAYVADSEFGLRAIDISNPAHPQEKGIFQTSVNAWTVAVDDDLAFVVDGNNLRIVDVSNPTKMQMLGFFQIPGDAWNVVASGRTAYVSAGEAGLLAIRYDPSAADSGGEGNPSLLWLDQNYPNPFNLQTTIRYILSLPNQATVRVYDLAGRRAKTLIDEYQTAGEHQVVLDGRGLASGVYVYELCAGGNTVYKKMLLIR
jgi:hypothetical protein